MKKYKVIYADPPWHYNNSGCRGAAENEYSVMKDEDIYKLLVCEYADPDSVLLLWATWPKLIEAMKVIDCWGFKYVTGMPWLKVNQVTNGLFGEVEFKSPYGIGFWVRGCSEPILIAKRGNAKPPLDGFIGLLSPNMFHSRKPESIYEYAESLDGPRLELFARVEREGWDVFGNEVKNSISLIKP